MLNRYYIIDDFYNNADQLVEAALESVQQQPLRGNYAGLMTGQSFLTTQHRELFKQLLLEPSIDSSTELNGKVRFSTKAETFKQHIHFDGFAQTRWSGVIYLSRNHPEVDGTCFWKHRATGLEEMPRTVEGLAEYGWKTNRDLQQFLESDGLDESKWEKTLTVPYRFNRAVFFRPWLFHSPGEAFGESLESSRMVQTLFLGQ